MARSALALVVSVCSPLLAAVDYASQVRPLLESKCYACHGPKIRTHGLRLDSRVAAFKGGDSGAPAVVPGKSSASLLYRYVAGLDPDVKMPPAGPRLAAAEIDLLKRWIEEGAPWPEDAPPAQTVRGQNHWAFRPRQRPDPPGVKNTRWVRNPIDAFILTRLESKGWKPSPPATPRQLLRRVYLDLNGLPPTVAEQESFLKNPDLDRVVDDLLARPAYGERWGRHWLDLARYAESNGYERDAAKPQAYKYRDYVIRAFNDDKPFDRFALEQLAGDQLDPVTPERLIATGYYRLGPWDDEPADPAEDRYDQLDDILATTSQAFLGLTLQCARCHNHKFEPLTAQDYYSMISIFNGLDRPRKGRTELDLPVGTREELAREAARDRKIAPLAEQIEKLREPYKKEKSLPAEVQAKVAELEAGIAEIKKPEPDLPRGYFLHEPKPDPPKTFLLIRGKAASPGPEVSPAVPAVLRQQPDFSEHHRRLTFARWIVSPDNPLTARVIVNRIWQHHFGEGLVRTPSDFGVMGEKPTHPELLDWLANWFVDNGWSIKKLNRLILSSNAWRMSKQWNAAYGAGDPENILLWRAPYTRLEVEAIRDSMLAVSGRLNPRMYGPSVFPEIPPAALEGSSDPDKIWKASEETEASRRSVYIFLKRSMIVPMLEVLDLCDTARTAAKRTTTSVAPQALTLFNSDFVNKQARYFAARLVAEAGADPARQVDLAYRLAVARPPTAAEKTKMLAFVREAGLEQLTRVIFNLNEFVYPD
jgi:uncharacterized protein DUF1553/uncharacterized protein DUF1549/cytochrome c